MRNIKMVLEYDGSKYYGWQRLGRDENKNTVENKIIEVATKMTGETPEIFCACRTELGVHANAQVINFKTNCELRTYEMKNYMNRYLPMDIAVKEVAEVNERFNASLNAKKKTYIYKVDLGDAPSVFNRKYSFYLFKNPDAEKMKEAAKKLIGQHDFKKFSTVKKNKSTVKNMIDIDIYKGADEMEITLTANDFLHNMARMIVATLIDIGIGAKKPEVIEEILDLNSDTESSAPAEAKGLFLDDIDFE